MESAQRTSGIPIFHDGSASKIITKEGEPLEASRLRTKGLEQPLEAVNTEREKDDLMSQKYYPCWTCLGQVG